MARRTRRARARDAPAHARDRARAHASTLDAARRRCSPAQVHTWQCKSRAHVHKSIRGTRVTRSPKDGTAPAHSGLFWTKGLRPKDGTAPHSGPKGYGQLSSHGSRLPTAPIRGTKPGHIRVVRTTTWDVVPRRGRARKAKRWIRACSFRVRRRCGS